MLIKSKKNKCGHYMLSPKQNSTHSHVVTTDMSTCGPYNVATFKETGVAVQDVSFLEYAKGTAIGFAPKARIAAYKVCNGNSGTAPFTVNHLPPWVLTVGASSIYREFRAEVVLGDSRTFMGASLYADLTLPYDRYQLVYAGDFWNVFCKQGGFNDPKQLAGKIIVCEDKGNVSTFEKAAAVDGVCGIGLVITNTEETVEELRAEPYPKPGVRVSYNDGNQIKQYIRSSQNPTATILFQGTIIGTVAPKVAAFSAGWTQAAGPWGDHDPRCVEFNIISGTSMACPHVSGVAALLKKAYLIGQSIKDLAMGTDLTPFSLGVGHVDPNRALNPGLVYDMGVFDYIWFLCSIGYDYQKIRMLLREIVSPNICAGTFVTPGDLNLPSFSVVFNNQVKTVRYKRTVKNVGSNVNATYAANWHAPEGTRIDVVPKSLVFNSDNPKQIYEITYSSNGGSDHSPRFGWIEWLDETHRVRSTIAFNWTTTITDSLVSI
ncbi:hypothetical protein TIFTF001_002931 [Ficus carica]|uniref:Uncharacterized protein n=1 Tax=Ficus carica TaxID=3494 RepID=A0AA87Z953_FICCA|nr:hypothetical protein TIFTF001_002931 [Ficus carica]